MISFQKQTQFIFHKQKGRIAINIILGTIEMQSSVELTAFYRNTVQLNHGVQTLLVLTNGDMTIVDYFKIIQFVL